jgi:hypothetical protein
LVADGILKKKIKHASYDKNLIIFLIANSNISARLGRLKRRLSSKFASNPALLRKIIFWTLANAASITSSRGAGGGCKAQYRFRGT